MALAAIHNTKYYIPIDHPILNDHGVLYPRALSQPLSFEITFAPVADVVVFSDERNTANYKIVPEQITGLSRSVIRHTLHFDN